MSSPKIPPHSSQAEQSVIGAILLDRDAVVKIADFLRPEHFYEEGHRAIFESILRLYEARSPLDVVTVSENLKKSKKETGDEDSEFGKSSERVGISDSLRVRYWALSLAGKLQLSKEGRAIQSAADVVAFFVVLKKLRRSADRSSADSHIEE